VPPIRWSQGALRNIVRLHDFLVAKNANAARRAVKTIRQGVQILSCHPEVGRPIDDLPPEFREWVIEFGQSAYVVFYRFDGKQIVLLTIRHGREAGY
jgi:plasmid stabilization system protein ParE